MFGAQLQFNASQSDVRNVNKCLPLARAFTSNGVFVIWVSFSSHAFYYFALLAFVKSIFLWSKFALFFIFSRDVFRFSPQITERVEEGTLFGAKYVSPSGQENIKILVSKNFFQTKFEKSNFSLLYKHQ